MLEEACNLEYKRELERLLEQYRDIRADLEQNEEQKDSESVVTPKTPAQESQVKLLDVKVSISSRDGEKRPRKLTPRHQEALKLIEEMR